MVIFASNSDMIPVISVLETVINSRALQIVIYWGGPVTGTSLPSLEVIHICERRSTSDYLSNPKAKSYSADEGQ